MSVINRIVAAPPPGGHRISFVRLDGTRDTALTELYADAGRLALGLRELGIGRGMRIGILASNCLEWVLLDLAALRLGAVTAGFEPGKFDPDPALLARYRLAVLFTDRGQEHPRQPDGLGIRPIGDVASLIPGADPAGSLPAVRYEPEDITTIKFTSGSTGEPKGLAATVASIDGSISAVQEMFGHGDGDNLFVFLPLSLLQQRYWIYSALRFGHDVTVSTYEAAFAALRRARPTVVMGVPGFYETAKKQIERSARGATSGEPLHAAAARLFGDRIRYLWTGSAPARPSMLRFFTEAGLPIYEGYGLNETCIVSKNHPRAHREGSVGQVLPGKKVLLDSGGVISVYSEHPVNWRYEYAAPGESQRVFSADGTVRTGDLGYIDDDGFLFIRGRADDVIVLDNGKKVIVRPLEEYFRASPAIEECVVFCPTQTHLVAVLSPAAEPADTAAITERLASANARFSRDEQISGVVVAPERFSIANGMLTSQFKPRRQQILAAHWTQVSAVARKDRDAR
ncbi:MAG TPA: AMP-binding protein [Streptosporangiaceae bacterium]|nr:AMP-binding protein [Streptosporangiaceae bacterium]